MTQPTNPELEIAAREEREQQERTAQKAAAALATKRAIFEDALTGIGITKGPRGRPGVLENALRLYVKHCEAHMGRLMGGGALGAQLYRNTPADPSLTPQLAVRARQAALDALFLLDAGELARHLKADLQEASTHHKLVLAHTKRCTHTDPVTGESTFHEWTDGYSVTPYGAERCTQCQMTRQRRRRHAWGEGDNPACLFCGVRARDQLASECPLTDQERRLYHGEWPVAYRPSDGATFLAADLARPHNHEEGIDALRMMFVAQAATGSGVVHSEREEPGPTLFDLARAEGRADLVHADLEERVRSFTGLDHSAGPDRTVAVTYRASDGTVLTREEWMAGQESSNADPVDAPDMGKAPPAD